MPTEEDAQAAVNRWLHGECRKLMDAETPDDAEAVVDNLDTDEANLAGPGASLPFSEISGSTRLPRMSSGSQHRSCGGPWSRPCGATVITSPG